MCWLSTKLAARASCRKRIAMSFIPAREASMILMASRFPISRCSASQTTPLEPAPRTRRRGELPAPGGAEEPYLRGLLEHTERLSEGTLHGGDQVLLRGLRLHL